MEVQSAEFDHTRNGFRRRGGYGAGLDREVRDVGRLLSGTVPTFLCSSLRRFSFLSVHFKGSCFAFLGPFFGATSWAKNGEKRG